MHALVSRPTSAPARSAPTAAIWQLVGNHWERLADVYPHPPGRPGLHSTGGRTMTTPEPQPPLARSRSALGGRRAPVPRCCPDGFR